LSANDKSSPLADTARAFALVMEFFATVLVLTGAGYLADRWQGTSPLYTLIGLGGGLVMAFYRFVRDGLRLSKRTRTAGHEAARRARKKEQQR
jgi:F0F1-type ATP synthase assembly protein I